MRIATMIRDPRTDCDELVDLRPTGPAIVLQHARIWGKLENLNKIVGDTQGK